MPVYEYQCTECGQIQEAFQKISDPPLETCFHCKGHLKGSGWYVTDYGGAKTGSKKESNTKSGTEPKESKMTSKKTTDSKD